MKRIGNWNRKRREDDSGVKIDENQREAWMIHMTVEFLISFAFEYQNILQTRKAWK